MPAVRPVRLKEEEGYVLLPHGGRSSLHPTSGNVDPAPAAILPFTGPYTAIWVLVRVPIPVLILTHPDAGAVKLYQTVLSALPPIGPKQPGFDGSSALPEQLLFPGVVMLNGIAIAWNGLSLDAPDPNEVTWRLYDTEVEGDWESMMMK
jgi:hypothetical protein